MEMHVVMDNATVLRAMLPRGLAHKNPSLRPYPLRYGKDYHAYRTRLLLVIQKMSCKIAL